MELGNELNIIEQMLNIINVSDDQISSAETFAPTALQMKSFIDKLPGGFLIYKADGDEEIIYANRALIKLFRCDTFEEFKELTGNSFKGFVYYEDLEEVENSIREQIANNQDELDYVEYRIMCKDGVIRWVDDYGHFVRTKSMGNIFYVFISDSTEKINKRNSELAALIREKDEKEKKFKDIIEEYDKERQIITQEHLRRLEVIEGLSINYESILYLDLDTDKMLPYRLSTRLKKQFNKKLQVCTFSSYVVNYLSEWVHPDDRELVETMLTPDCIRQKLGVSQSYYFNYRCVENGETKYIQLRLVDVGNDGHVSQVVMGCRNIDKEVLQEMDRQKFLEEALNNAKLASIAKNTFLSNMSHDMRTPLNAIFGFTALANKNIKDKKAVISYLEKINAAGRQIFEIVEKVLEISYTESQDFQIREHECNIQSIAKEIFDSIKPEADKKNITVSLHSDSVKNSDVYADKDKLIQILHHIAANAVKYTGKDGKIDFTVEQVESHSDEFASFRFIMKDNGIGMQPDFLKRIFEPFERERDSTHSGIFGTGLGLTIAKHIIEIMGGEIQAESSVGKGSTFTVSLSLRLAEENATENQGEGNLLKFLKNKKILIVEDNEINLEIETEMLEDLGLKIDSAENGKIAVEKVASSKPGEYLFVLMDIQMPVMDGRKATEAIRKLDNAELKEIPIIALSANAFESDKRMSIETGMDAHLTKPIDIPELLETLKKVLYKRKK